MTIAILATGDELIHGDTLNTNGREIAQILSSEGLPLGLHLMCGDKEAEITECLHFLRKRHTIILVIGGLGPTTDDRTRFALSKCTGDPLVQNQDALHHVTHHLHPIKVTLNEGNLQQCLFPKNARILPNPYGSAVGCYYHWDNTIFILLPGPPRECLPMLSEHAFPLIQKTLHSNKQIIKWRIFGLAESEIAQTLEEALAGIECQTGYRLETPYIEFKVRCVGQLIEKVKSIIDPIIAPHCIATPEKKASKVLQEYVTTLKEPITIIDDATFGALETALIQPGLQELVYFHGENTTTIRFHLTGLDDYWLQKPCQGTTSAHIHYQNGTKEGQETHTLPYRSPSIIPIATEWLSFRLFHLLNQLH